MPDRVAISLSTRANVLSSAVTVRETASNKFQRDQNANSATKFVNVERHYQSLRAAVKGFCSVFASSSAHSIESNDTFGGGTTNPKGDDWLGGCRKRFAIPSLFLGGNRSYFRGESGDYFRPI